MAQTSRLLFRISSTLLVTFSMAGAVPVAAQSGRRAEKPTSVPIVVPEVKPTEKQAEKGGLPFIVGVDRYLDLTTIPLTFYDAITRGCANRLDDATAVKVEIVRDELSRSDAVSRAKSEKEGYVVWLQLKLETLYADPTNVNDLTKLYIEYSVFAATTAKRVAFGHTYQQGYRKGAVVLPRSAGRGSVSYSEQMLQEAARETAESILDQLKIPPHGSLPTTITAPGFVPLRHKAFRSRRDTFHQLRAASPLRLALAPRHQ